MKGFIGIDGEILINADRLIAAGRRKSERSLNEWYVFTFDTQQEITVSLEDGAELMKQIQAPDADAVDGTMATTSERST